MHARYSLFLILVPLLALISGCGEDQTVQFPGRGGEVFFVYPDDGQEMISTRAKVVVRLSDPIADPTAVDDSSVQLFLGETPVPASVAVAEGSDNRSLVLTPTEPMEFGASYRYEMPGVLTDAGVAALPEGGISFTTAYAFTGPKSTQIGDPEMKVMRMFPDDAQFPIIDFSSLRFQFSQPLDPASVRYGDNVLITDSEGATVPAFALAKGHFLTLDPVEDLIPDQSYTVTLGDSVRSRFSVSLLPPFAGSHSLSFTPMASGPTETMVLKVPADGVPSQLTGQPVNLVPVIATLLGTETESQQEGNVFSELGFVPRFPETTPIRVKRGRLLVGDELVVRIGGVVPAGFNSGDVTVQFISDATGYLLPNPYSTAPDAPRQVRLWMDVAISTADPEANAAFNQDVLHLELIGQAIVENGVLVADALTVVETDILGLETAFGSLSFRMEGFLDQTTAPAPAPDLDPPTLQSWMPGDFAAAHRPGEPIILNFTKALDPRSLVNRIELRENDLPVEPTSIRHDGVSVVIQQPVQYGNEYTINLLDGITDINGNPLAAQTLSFAMVDFDPAMPSSPIVLSSFPGFPCPTVNRDLANNNAGRCDGGQTTDDRLPLAAMPADRAITMEFSQIMDSNSIRLGETFLVETVDASGVAIAPVTGQLSLRDRQLSFLPDQPWQVNQLYRYTLVSNGDSASSACNPTSMVCSEDGLPLRTRLLSQAVAAAPALNGGGPNLSIFFRGAPTNSNVFTQLSNLPTADVNSNTRRDPGEDNAVDNPLLLANSARIIVTDSSGQVAEANVGCPVGSSCPRQQLAYLSGALGGEVVGFLDPQAAAAVARAPLPAEVVENGGVLVYLHPTNLLTSNIVVHAETTLEPLTTADPADSGPLVMRIRYECDARTSPAAPAPAESQPLRQCDAGESGFGEGWIVEGQEKPRFLTTLNGYLDAPALNPIARALGIPIPMTHNQRSFGFTAKVSGDIEFLDDGRMQIALANEAPIVVTVEIAAAGVLEGSVELTMPLGEVILNVISAPVKR